MIICEYCLQEILSHGEAVIIRDYESNDPNEEEHLCEWCEDLCEVSELVDII